MHRIDEPHPFALETATLQYAPDRPVTAKHLAIDLALDFAKQSISGVVTHTVEAVREVSAITFDAVELQISRVDVDGKRVSFDAGSGQQLHVTLSKPLAAGDTAKVRITYRATPRRGLYFVGPDEQYPQRPKQVWTQGQDIDSRWYFPCLDTPAQKCPSELTATFPASMTALSNGALVEDVKLKGQRRMRYRLDQPHSPYLVTLVVGEFETLEEKNGKTKVTTWYPKGRKADALRCVKGTPKMMALFEKLTGRVYPWGDYAQVFVSEFIFGGMENTSATTLTDSVLHDERAALDYSAEFLIAHELAHQWFGDLLTCRDWPHGWLNEGFATYSEVLWKEEADGVDEADHVRAGDLDAYLDEVSSRYARPIVARKFDAPIDLFDRHLYEKGGLVLHELRTRLGDDAFFSSVRHYVAAHAHGSVETVDLARSVEVATGRNLDRFFDEYVLRAGHPELKVEVSYQSESKTVRVSVKQTQAGEVFALTLPVEVTVQKKSTTHRFELTDKEHVFTVPVEREPSRVVIDGHRDLLATISVEQPPGYFRDQLRNAKVARARTDAAGPLGKEGSAESIAALGDVLLNEKAFFATRAACAKALGAIRTPVAKAALLEALTVKNPKARRAVVVALGQFKGDEVVGAALLALAKKGDPSIFVEADAARAVGKLKPKGAFEVLETMLSRTSFSDTVKAGALDGLTELKDPRGWKLVTKAAEYGQSPWARRGACHAMAKLAEPLEKKTEAVERLTQLLRDPGFRVRLGAMEAATALADERMIGPLTSTPFLDGREQRLAREAARNLRVKSPAKELASVRAELDALKTEVRALKEKVAVATPKKK
jgi:aminopeptidase N